jgi:hypothetical protein
MECSAQLKESIWKSPDAHEEARIGSIPSAQQESVVRMVASWRLGVGECSHFAQKTVQWDSKMASGLH